LQVTNFDREKLAEEAALLARAHKGVLGNPTQRVDPSALSAKLLKLKEESAGFGPNPEVLRLDEVALAARGITPGSRLRQLLGEADFYAVTFAVTLFPKVDWRFDRLEAQVEFSAPGTDAARAPVAFDLYPQDEWDTLVRANVHLEVGVTEGLEFACSVPANAAGLSAAAQAKVAGGASFVVPPRDYGLRRAKVLSRGRGNAEVFWRLYDAAYLERQEPQLGVVLKVPKGGRPVRARGTLAAYRSAKFWTAALGALFADFTERLHSWISAGTPLYGHGDWTVVHGD
jgi:hypothetical protein